MKTLRHKEAGNLKRRPDEEAHKMFETGKWEYVSKSVWKEYRMKEVKSKMDDRLNHSESKEKSNKISKATKRHLRKKNK